MDDEITEGDTDMYDTDPDDADTNGTELVNCDTHTYDTYERK